jgi:hypothetical protein
MFEILTEKNPVRQAQLIRKDLDKTKHAVLKANWYVR